MTAPVTPSRRPRTARALALIASRAFHVVLTDLRMPGMDGMALLHELRRELPETEIIVLTAHGSIENAVQAIKEGAAGPSSPVNGAALSAALAASTWPGNVRNRRTCSSAARSWLAETRS